MSTNVNKVLESIGEETSSHLNSVKALIKPFVERLGLNPKVVEFSQYHDIGKNDVPKEILYKPGKFTAEEFEEVKKHTTYGLKYIPMISSDSDEQTILRDLILHHHERWDGTGYPTQKAGTEIPLTARAMTIVDIYDALRTERVYKKAWSHEKVVEYFKEEQGKIFDPVLVELFLQIEKEINDIYEKTNA